MESARMTAPESSTGYSDDTKMKFPARRCAGAGRMLSPTVDAVAPDAEVVTALSSPLCGVADGRIVQSFASLHAIVRQTVPIRAWRVLSRGVTDGLRRLAAAPVDDPRLEQHREPVEDQAHHRERQDHGEALGREQLEEEGLQEHGETLVGADVLGDDGAGQREGDCDLQAREDLRKRSRKQQLRVGLPLRGAERAEQVLGVLVDRLEPEHDVDEHGEEADARRHRDLRGDSEAEPAQEHRCQRDPGDDLDRDHEREDRPPDGWKEPDRGSDEVGGEYAEKESEQGLLRGHPDGVPEKVRVAQPAGGVDDVGRRRDEDRIDDPGIARDLPEHHEEQHERGGQEGRLDSLPRQPAGEHQAYATLVGDRLRPRLYVNRHSTLHPGFDAHDRHRRICITMAASAPVFAHRDPASRSSRRRILPETVFGSSSRMSMLRGHLYAASRSRQKAISSSVSARAPGLRLTNARTVSPRYSSGAPTTAASWTAGCS